MACVSSLAIGAFALNSWSNTLLHKFFFKKIVRQQQKKYKKEYKKGHCFGHYFLLHVY